MSSTLRLVAQYADAANLLCGVDEIPRKLDAIAGHCERLGRDRSEITVSHAGLACIAPTHDQAVAELDAALRSVQGIDVASMSKEDADAIRSAIPHGDPDEIGEIFPPRSLRASTASQSPPRRTASSRAGSTSWARPSPGSSGKHAPVELVAEERGHRNRRRRVPRGSDG